MIVNLVMVLIPFFSLTSGMLDWSFELCFRCIVTSYLGVFLSLGARHLGRSHRVVSSPWTSDHQSPKQKPQSRARRHQESERLTHDQMSGKLEIVISAAVGIMPSQMGNSIGHFRNEILLHSCRSHEGDISSCSNISCRFAVVEFGIGFVLLLPSSSFLSRLVIVQCSSNGSHVL